MAEGLDLHACRNVGIADDAVRAHRDTVAQAHLAFEDTADVDLHVLAATQNAPHVDARWVGEAHAGVHQNIGLHALVAAFEIGQLMRAVHAQHFGLACRSDADHGNAFGHGHGHDVGEVVLALHVVVAQRHDPAREHGRGCGHDAGVDLADGALRHARVLVFDDALNVAALVAQHAAIAGGVAQLNR